MTDDRRGGLPARLLDALAFACDATRTGGSEAPVPDVAELLGVPSLILDHGGTDDEAIAGTLVDAVTVDEHLDLAALGPRFGGEVVGILAGWMHHRPVDDQAHAWSAVRQAAIDALADADDSTASVMLARELYDLRLILTDLREAGPALWEELPPGRDDHLWYYEALSEVAQCRQWPRCPSRLANEVVRAVGELRLAAHGPPSAHPRPSDWDVSTKVEHPCGARHPMIGKRCRRPSGHAGIHGYSPRPGDGKQSERHQ